MPIYDIYDNYNFIVHAYYPPETQWCSEGHGQDKSHRIGPSKDSVNCALDILELIILMFFHVKCL